MFTSHLPHEKFLNVLILFQCSLKLRPQTHFKNIIYEDEEADWLDFLINCSETKLGHFFPTKYAKFGDLVS